MLLINVSMLSCNEQQLYIFFLAFIYIRFSLYKSHLLYITNQELDSDSEEPSSGCTACAVIMRGNKLVVANAGDSRCVLSKGGQVILFLPLCLLYFFLCMVQRSTVGTCMDKFPSLPPRFSIGLGSIIVSRIADLIFVK